MNKEELIKRIETNISLYKRFTCPDYPDLGIFANQYKDILVKIFDNAKTNYSIIYSDVNKLSVVNERYGKEVGDKTLYSLLNLFTKSQFMPKDALTIRIGGDEFITFVPNKDKEQVEKIIKSIQVSIDRQRDFLYGSSITFGVEDSQAGNFESIFTLAEHKVELQKLKNRQKDAFLTEANNSKFFVKLPVPENITDEQQDKWEILNTKINVAIDNHLRDIRPSNPKFEYNFDTIRPDAKTLIYAFANLLNSRKVTPSAKNLTESNILNISFDNASIIHSLFQGQKIDLNLLNEEKLNNLLNDLDGFCSSLIRNKHSNLLTKSYYRIYLADMLYNSKQNYQCVYYSMSGIRPSNTAYGHAITDIILKKTYNIATNECTKKREINNTPFNFNKNDSFLIDQDGGNIIQITPMNQHLTEEEVEDITVSINSHHKQSQDSTFKVASAIKNNVNRKTIPLYINSRNDTKKSPIEFIRTINQYLKNRVRKTKLLSGSTLPSYLSMDKPFVQFARYLKQICNSKKDPIKVESLEGKTNQYSLEAIFEDCIQYYLSEIDDATSITTQKLLLDNVMIALSNHEVYNNAVNKKINEKKVDSRKIIKNLFNLNKDASDLEEEEEK